MCDVGGGSTEIGVGTPEGGVAWMRSFDLGAVRLTRRFVDDDPCGRKAVEKIRAEVAAALDSAVPPLPRMSLATGGTARAIGKAVGPALGPAELDVGGRGSDRDADARPTPSAIESIRRASSRSPPAPCSSPRCSALLETPLIVARGGLREGAVLDLFDRVEAAAA